MANQEKIDKKLKELEDQYSALRYRDEFNRVRFTNTEKADKIELKYAKILLKAKMNEEDAKALRTLKRKRFGLKLAKAGATILKGLGLAASVLIPMAAGAGIGALIGLAINAELAPIIGGLIGTVLAGGADIAVWAVKGDEIDDFVDRKIDEPIDDIIVNNAVKIKEIKFDMACQADRALNPTPEEKSEPEPTEADSLRAEALDKLRTATEQARQAQAQETATEPEA